MIILRVEDVHGQGPYHDIELDSCHACTMRAYGLFEKTTPDNDPKLKEALLEKNVWPQHGSPFLFGFDCQNQLHAWFSPLVLQKLSVLGFYLVEIEVPRIDVFFGTTQCVYDAHNAQYRERRHGCAFRLLAA